MVPVSDPKTAKKMRWLEPSMSENHDNNRQIRPENPNMMSQLMEILSTTRTRKPQSSSCSPWWSWFLKNEMRCVVSAANNQSSEQLNLLSRQNNQD
jgi:hypothetical protein